MVNSSLIHIDGIRSELGRGVAIRAIKADTNGIIWFGHSNGISYIDEEEVINYYESDGLISNDVWCLETDSKGNTWIGTIDGVSIFDGQRFTYFGLPEGVIDSTLGVSSTSIVHNIMEESIGKIWFNTNGGIYIKDKDSLIEISEKDGLKTNFVNKVIETQKGEFVISSLKGLYLYTNDSVADISRNLFKEIKGSSNVIETSNGDIWFNSARNIYCLINNDLTEHRISEGNYGPLTYQIYRDRYDRVWFVGWGGAFRFENGKILNITKDGPW